MLESGRKTQSVSGFLIPTIKSVRVIGPSGKLASLLGRKDRQTEGGRWRDRWKMREMDRRRDRWSGGDRNGRMQVWLGGAGLKTVDGAKKKKDRDDEEKLERKVDYSFTFLLISSFKVHLHVNLHNP